MFHYIQDVSVLGFPMWESLIINIKEAFGIMFG